MGSQVSERRGNHSRERSRDKWLHTQESNFPNIHSDSGYVSRTHSRNSSWDNNKNEDIMGPTQRRTSPPSILPPHGCARKSEDQSTFKGNGFSSIQLSQAAPIGSLAWATDTLTSGSQSSKRLLHKSLAKISTSFTYNPRSSSLPHFNNENYCSSPNEKAMLAGHYPSRYYYSFRQAPIGYTVFHAKRHFHNFANTVLQPRRLLGIVIAILLLLFTFRSNIRSLYKSNRFLGGGSKIVIILASNQGGGVLGWKGAKEWYVERESIRNKKEYAAKHGYTLEIRDSKSLKRYAHEWRESWEKVDVLKQTMKKYPKAEWFWYLDIQTFIMEPEVSLEQHIFRRLGEVTFRDLGRYNPMNITHPPRERWLDKVSRSRVGDGRVDSVDLIVPQDCAGFNLGSFFARRSEFTERLLDAWWDPVGYEQLHMRWEHKEQDVLAHLYTHQPWTRNGIAFIPQRMINSFPPGACRDKAGDKNIFYQTEDRDFLVNMAGCEWGRDCADEMKHYSEISEKLNSKRRWL